MVQINFSLKEVNCKVVYYGPGLSGKTTNLEIVHQKAPSASTGELTSIATEGDRTLFFDFLPLNLGQVAGMKTKFQIYTVPGQCYYNSTRKLVLQGADGVVFVADSKKGKMQENIESLENLSENLREYGLNIDTIPIVLQYNKRDLPEVYSVEEMDKALNRWNAPTFEAVARDGVGVFPTLKCLAGCVLEALNKQSGSQTSSGPRPARRSAMASPASATAASAPSPVPVSATAPARVPVAAAATATAVATPPRPQVAPRPAPVVQAQAPGTHAAPAARVAPARPAAVPQPTPAVPARKGKGNGKLVIGVVFLVVAGLAAYMYFSGLWEKLLP